MKELLILMSVNNNYIFKFFLQNIILKMSLKKDREGIYLTPTTSFEHTSTYNTKITI